jgi:hypothetical protein
MRLLTCYYTIIYVLRGTDNIIGKKYYSFEVNLMRYARHDQDYNQRWRVHHINSSNEVFISPF